MLFSFNQSQNPAELLSTIIWKPFYLRCFTLVGEKPLASIFLTLNEESTEQFWKIHFRITVGIQNFGNDREHSGVKWWSPAQLVRNWKVKWDKYTVGIAIFLSLKILLYKTSEVLIPILSEYSSFATTWKDNQRPKNFAWLVTCVTNNATQTSGESACLVDVRVVRENFITIWDTEPISALATGFTRKLRLN